ncbi:uncharacterized protein LOC124594373 [Schistocerca americana]|uniref:uncharacterized protein LOC124594373 n=1 Tax=Schistocerca americana TaxID=7009 RepID=UPI001F4FED79|nr:uncharacterized protein LOC124594373 [Schistocerca americana]
MDKFVIRFSSSSQVDTTNIDNSEKQFSQTIKNPKYVFCQFLARKNAFDSSIALPSATATSEDRDSGSAFVLNGFSEWQMGTERVRFHEKCTLQHNSNQPLLTDRQLYNLHLQLSNSLSSIQLSYILQYIDDIISKEHQKITCRHNKKLDGLKSKKDRFSANNPQANLHQFHLLIVAVNEIVSLVPSDAQKNIVKSIKDALYFSLIVDETSDVSVKEQLSICFRYLDKNLQVEEVFMGF